MVRVDLPAAANSYLVKICFKRWAKLWTPGNLRLQTAEKAAALEKRDYLVGKTLQLVPFSWLVKLATHRRYAFKKRMAGARPVHQDLPTAFLLECYNPAVRVVAMSLLMRATDERAKVSFQRLIELQPGFNRLRIRLQEIAAFLDVERPFEIEIVPNADCSETTLYFGLMDFVVEAAENKSSKKVKCIVWDLDNTVWDGVLVEDGPDRLRLKTDIANVIRTLDARGILHSIASKNNPEEALGVLKRFQLDEFFLCPQISWQPKSQGIKAIAQQLNIGVDSILFIDDSRFEVEEVRTASPDVQVLFADQYKTLLERDECNVSVTAESRERRKLYQVEMNRQAVAQSFSSDYLAFLRYCQIRLTVHPMTEENLERVHELTQRTNQMNFSGNRYDREVLRQLLSTPPLDSYVLSCEDRFGSYGVIGFSLVDAREPRMIDLMFSCRIQSKRVEHAFLAYLIRRYTAETGKDFYANYRKTPRNAPSGQVFADLHMEEGETKDGILSLRFPKGRQVLEDGVINVVIQDGVLVH